LRRKIGSRLKIRRGNKSKIIEESCREEMSFKGRKLRK